jgi:hypothetical protein
MGYPRALPSPVSVDKENPLVFARIPPMGNWIPALDGTTILITAPASTVLPRPTNRVRKGNGADGSKAFSGANESQDGHCCIASAVNIPLPDPPSETIDFIPDAVNPGRNNTTRSNCERPMLELKVNVMFAGPPARGGMKSSLAGCKNAPIGCTEHEIFVERKPSFSTRLT